MSARILRRIARGLAVAGIVLIVCAFYGPAWNDADEGSLVLLGLLACWTAVTLRARRRL